MPRWEAWMEMAEESIKAAGMISEEAPRSAISRYYYAGYQAASALLIYKSLPPPTDREAWSHEDTPVMIVEHLASFFPRRNVRQNLRNRLRTLYKARVSADYSGASGSVERLGEARKDAEYLLKVAGMVLKEGRQ